MRPTPLKDNFKLLRYLGGTKDLKLGKVIHAHLIVSKHCSWDNISESNALIDLYSKCETLESARRVFNQMNKRNIVSWSALMSGYSQNGCTIEVLRLYKSMVSDHNKSYCLPNEYISGLVLSSCINIGYLLLGRQCHGYMLKSGLVFKQYVKTALVRLYSMLSDMAGAMEVSVSNSESDACTYNLILVGLVEKGYLDEALIFLRKMLAKDIVCYKDTYIAIIGLCAHLKDLDLGLQVHNKLLKSDVEFDESLCSAMIKMYSKCENILSARNVFKSFEPQSVVIWTAILAAYSEQGFFEVSLKLFIEMQHEDVAPNESTFSVLLNVSAELFSMRCGNSLHALAEKTGFKDHKNVEDALISMYSRTGDIKAAKKVFLGMTNRDIVTWNTMICGYLHHGFGHKCLALFKEMLELGEDPDYVTFVGVLSACGQVGLVKEGYYYFYELVKEKGVEPGLDHYMCMVNMLVKAGQLYAALDFIASTPSKWDAYAWCTLLSGFHAHQDYTLCTRVAELIPDDVATEVNKLCGVTEFHELMETRDINQDRGLSWVDIKNKTYAFVPVDSGDPEFINIHKLMKSLLASIKANSRDNVHDTDAEEEMKYDCNGYHSEEHDAGDCDDDDDHMRGEFAGDSDGYDPRSDCPPNFDPDYCGYDSEELRGDCDGYDIEELGGDRDGYNSEELGGDRDDYHSKRAKDCDHVYHSEELAVAYALLKTHDMSPICIIKSSGEICDNCHSLIKLISEATNRLIMVRDSHFFHNFQHGRCSCADYW